MGFFNFTVLSLLFQLNKMSASLNLFEITARR